MRDHAHQQHRRLDLDPKLIEQRLRELARAVLAVVKPGADLGQQRLHDRMRAMLARFVARTWQPHAQNDAVAKPVEDGLQRGLHDLVVLIRHEVQNAAPHALGIAAVE